MITKRVINLLCWLSLIVMALAWHFPGSPSCALLSWIACFLLVKYLPLSDKPYGIFYSAGLALYAIGFYWLFFTIRDFGGFNNLIAFLIFGLFIAVSATQFLIFVFVWKKLPLFFHRNYLAIALAWFVSENLSVRIFPWHLAHSQLAYTYFVQVADIAGTIPVSFLMLWFAEAGYNLACKRKFDKAISIALLFFIVINLYGYIRTEQFSKNTYPKQDVTLVQANISLEEKHDVLLPRANINRYIELSKDYSNKDILLIWPESVLTEFVSSKLKNISDDPYNRIPYIENTALVFGALTYESREKFYNSAIGISADGSIAGIYHKQILMPFGEFTPFSESLPWLKELNSTVSEFSAGTKTEVITMPITGKDDLRFTTLICYEDVIPQLSREASIAGAEVLINLTNDAWFGNTIAPYEHNLIASFRAIENRRFLLRSTNTGLTAIINPLGKTVASLKPYTEGVLHYQIERINFKSPLSYFDFYKFSKLLSIILLLLTIFRIIAIPKSPFF